MSEVPTTCIIGAGSSGIAAAKALHEAGLEFDCYEKGDRVGGNWAFDNSNGMSSAYRSLFINTSRGRMQYSDFPMPGDYPHFPHHTQIAAYFERYVDHFGFRHRIRFNTSVERASLREDGIWEVRLDTGETRLYDALIVANGHHWDPRWPEPPFPGRFDGVEMHSHDYKEPKQLEGRRVVVVGMGNSAMDIAVDASYVAERTFLAARRGAYIVPKYLFGRPFDVGQNPPWVPLRLRQAVAAAILRLHVGRPENFGLPRPDHRFGEAHPTVSGRILERIGHGTVTPKPNLAELLGDRVRFADGSVEEADTIVYCTGYKVTFPFFDPEFVSAPDNDLPLYRRVFKPGLDSLFFVGLLQPLGAIMPLAEVQSKLIVSYLKGEYALPSRAAMEADVERERERMRRRYVASKRHTMQVDFEEYLAALRREARSGAKRAAAAGKRPPITARAKRLEAAARGATA